MPRIRQYEKQYADEDFRREISGKGGYAGLRSTRALALAIGVPASTLADQIREPETMKVKIIRLVVGAIHPDPAIILRLVGYTSKEIKQFKEAAK